MARFPTSTICFCTVGVFAATFSKAGETRPSEKDESVVAAKALKTEIPEEPSLAESLTAEQARSLVARYRGSHLLLNRLSTLNADTAAALAAFNRDDLHLGGVTAVDCDTARALAGCLCSGLHLPGVPQLDAEAAKAIVGFKGRTLTLSGLTSLNADTAAALAGSEAWDGRLPKVSAIDAATARALAAYKGILWLDGLTSLDLDTANALVGFGGKQLKLEGLTALDGEVAAALARSPAWDGRLPSVARLNAGTAEALVSWKGRNHSELFLPGLQTLDGETARVLANAASVKWGACKDRECGFGEPRHLGSLTEIDAAAAAVLAQSEKWDGFLPSLTAFMRPESVAVARALATRKGQLFLPNLKKISPKTLSALLKKNDVEIPPIETLELIPEPDGSATDDFVIPEGFERRQRRQ
ncbi:MAG: hypothetical protein ACK6CT_06835 [Planctomycetia bacterium]|jgi:hypothetical protein